MLAQWKQNITFFLNQNQIYMYTKQISTPLGVCRVAALYKLCCGLKNCTNLLASPSWFTLIIQVGSLYDL